MSHPLKRRIAQAALLVAAGATPLIAVGHASAADLVPQGTDLGSGLTQLDSPGGTVQDAAHELGRSAGATGAATVSTGVPAASDAAGHTVASALPDADRSLGPVTNTAARTTATTGALSTLAGEVAPALVDRAGPAVAEKVLPSVPALSSLPSLPSLPSAPGTRSLGAQSPLGTLTGALPTSGLPTGTLTSALPTGGIPQALPGADALGPLTGAPAAANRLGGVPSLGSNPTDLLGGLLGGGLGGGLGPVGGLLGGIGG